MHDASGGVIGVEKELLRDSRCAIVGPDGPHRCMPLSGEQVAVCDGEARSGGVGERLGGHRIVLARREQGGDGAGDDCVLCLRKCGDPPQRAVLTESLREGVVREDRILRERGGDALVVVERGFFRAVDRQREPLSGVVEAVDIPLGEWGGSFRSAFGQAIDDVRQHPNRLGVVERVEESGHQVGIAQMERERTAIGGVLDRDREGRLGAAREQIQQGLLEVGVLLAALGIARARREHRVDGGEEARGCVLVAVDLRRIHAVEDHRLQPFGPVAHDRQRQARTVRQAVKIPLVVPERGAQIGEVGGALGARVRRQVDALGRQPVTAGRDLLAPSRAPRVAREECAVHDEVLGVEFRAVQRGLGEPRRRAAR